MQGKKKNQDADSNADRRFKTSNKASLFLFSEASLYARNIFWVYLKEQDLQIYIPISASM